MVHGVIQIHFLDVGQGSLSIVVFNPNEECDLRLMSGVSDTSEIPKAGKSLIIVALVDHVLHFRIFDGADKMIVDTDEKRLAERKRQVEDLRNELESLWPPHELIKTEKARVIEAVRSIVGHPKPQAIVIDHGADQPLVLDVLEKCGVRYIASLILIQNHPDKDGSSQDIITSWARQRHNPASGQYSLGQIWYLKDGSSASLQLVQVKVRESKRGLKLDLRPLESASAGSRQLFRAPVYGGDIVVEALGVSPEDPGQEGRSDVISGAIQLRYREQRVLFGADPSTMRWTGVVQEQGASYEAVAVVPRENSTSTGSPNGDAGGLSFWDRIRANKAIFSFSASNQSGHPSPVDVNAALAGGATILCTEITPTLNGCRHTLGQGVIRPTWFSASGRSREVDAQGKPVHVACAGSMTVTLGPWDPSWGNQGEPDSICGFESLEEFQRRVQERCQSLGHIPDCHRRSNGAQPEGNDHGLPQVPRADDPR
jgi:hypothetical protein